MRARTQFAAAATAVAALLVALTGQFLLWRLDQRDRADLDRALAARAAQISADVTRTGQLPTDGVYAVRLMSGSQVRAQSGSTVRFSAPVADGYSTVAAADGRLYRSWAETLRSGVQFQVLTSLADVQARHAEAVRLVDGSVLVAILLGGLATWFAGGILLRPLRRLQEGAGQLRPGDLSGRLPGVAEPREVAEIAASVNALLDRMQAAAEAGGAPASPLALPAPASARPGSAGALPAALSLALPAVSTVTPPPAVPDSFPPRAAQLALPAASSERTAAPPPGADRHRADREGPDRNGAGREDADRGGVDRNGAGAEATGPGAADRDADGWEAAGPDEEALRDALAKLGDDLDTLLDNPELSATQRHLILASIQNEYRRILLLVRAGDPV